MCWIHRKNMIHSNLISFKEILPINGQLVISGHSTLRNFRNTTFKLFRPFIYSLEKENKFPYCSNPNQFLGLNELIIDLAKLDRNEEDVLSGAVKVPILVISLSLNILCFRRVWKRLLQLSTWYLWKKKVSSANMYLFIMNI